MAQQVQQASDGGGGTGTDGPDLQHADLPAVFAAVESSSDGLSAREAASRLTRDGPNAIEETRRSPVLQFLSYFWGPIPIMIEAALICAAILGDWGDVGVIGAMLLLNGIIGWWEERQAGNAIDALKKQLASEAKVKRDGQWTTCPASEVVAGDVIRVRLGDVVPADARLLSGQLQLDQSALTGESLPVSQSDGGVAYSGSVAVKGEADAVVIGTGTRTFFGRTAQLVATAGVKTHYQRAVTTLMRVLIVASVVGVLVTLISGVARGNDFFDMLEFALVLLIAGVPVALPAVTSVTMAVGAATMAKQQAIVTHLPAIEEVGGLDTLCSDKTGTLTQNRLTVREPAVTGVQGASSAEDVLTVACLASKAEDQDLIDLAVLRAVDDGKVRVDGYTQTDFTPFDPVTKRTEATIATSDGSSFMVTKGAPQAVLALVPTDDPHHDELARQVDAAVQDFAVKGERALGVARDDGDGWRMLGVLPLADPPRPDSKSTIESAEELGIDVKLVTGDNVAIARTIAGEVGLGTNIVDATTLELGTEEADAHDAAAAQGADGFAQVFPEHKYEIVHALQSTDHIVGMTGDGVNDAPALKQADCGIAVSGATDAARAAADIVLLTPGLSVIVNAIRASREIFERMTTYTIYRVTETIALVFFIALMVVVTNEKPIITIAILLLAMINDGSFLTIAYDRARPSPRPQTWDMGRLMAISSVLGVFVTIMSVLVFVVPYYVWDVPLGEVQTIVFLKLSVAGAGTVFVARTRGPWWSVPPATALLVAVVVAQVLATLISIFGFWMLTPIPWDWAAWVWLYCIVGFLLMDPLKLLLYRWLGAPGTPRKGADDATPSTPAPTANATPTGAR